MKKYNIVPGLTISLFIAVLVFVPRIIRFGDEENLLRSLGNGLVIFATSFCCWVTNQFFLQSQWPKNIWSKAVLSLVSCMILSVIFLYPTQDYSEVLPMLTFKGLSETRKIMMMAFRGLVIAGFSFFTAYHLNLLLFTQNARIENEMLKQENLQARLNLLKQQVNPHFLFNSLSTLRSIAPDNPTRQYVMQLSNVYRYLLNNEENHLAFLRDELAFTNSYLYILKERFEEALQIEIDVPQAMLIEKIPPYSLQIVIESVVKHNIVSFEKPLGIHIYVEENHLCVQNNLQRKISTEESTGKGLRNIRERYRLLSSKEIEIIDNENEFIVKLPVL